MKIRNKVLNFRVNEGDLRTFKKICKEQGETVSNTLNQLVSNFNQKFKSNGTKNK